MEKVFSKYEKHLRPEFLQFCRKMLEEDPAIREFIPDILEFRRKETEKVTYFKDTAIRWLCPPYEWMAEEYKKGEIWYTNGLFWIHIKQNKNNVTATIDTAYLGSKDNKRLKFNFKKRTETYENVWEAMWHLGFLQEQLDKEYLE